MVYVQPTRGMGIRVGGGVAGDGRVTCGVVADWERKWEVSVFLFFRVVCCGEDDAGEASNGTEIRQKRRR